MSKIQKIALGLGLGNIILALVVYAGYLYSQRYGAATSLPLGRNYLGGEAIEQSLNFGQSAIPPTAPLIFTAGPEVPWKEYKGKIHPYSFQYPETLKLGSFPDDPSDAVAIILGNIPPQNNILLNVESIFDRDLQYTGKVEEFARNWWRFFSGLTGLRSIEKFTNSRGLIGYRAIYINTAGQSPTVDIFFEIPGDPNKTIRIANGILDLTVFNRIVDSVGYDK